MAICLALAVGSREGATVGQPPGGLSLCRWALHGPYVYVSVRASERRGLLYVPAAIVEVVKRRVDTTGRIEAALAEISAINLELVARGELE